MQSSKPALDVWDSCCLIGILNGETDKVPALLAQTRFFETGAAMLGLPIAVLDEVVTLADGTSAEEKVRAFLLNPYVLPLYPNLEISFKSKGLFDSDAPDQRSPKAVSQTLEIRAGLGRGGPRTARPTASFTLATGRRRREAQKIICDTPSHKMDTWLLWGWTTEQPRRDSGCSQPPRSEAVSSSLKICFRWICFRGSQSDTRPTARSIPCKGLDLYKIIV